MPHDEVTQNTENIKSLENWGKKTECGGDFQRKATGIWGEDLWRNRPARGYLASKFPHSILCWN